MHLYLSYILVEIYKLDYIFISVWTYFGSRFTQRAFLNNNQQLSISPQVNDYFLFMIQQLETNENYAK